MPEVIFTRPSGAETKVVVVAGTSVMRAAVGNAVDGIIGECGGDMVCATCHVFVQPEWFERLDPAGDYELDMLEATSEEPTPYSRLGCQIVLTDDLCGLTVEVPNSQR
jgi:2Fe-2S ferredoxin